MSLKDLKSLSAEELLVQKDKLLGLQFGLRMQKGMGETIKPHLFKQYRRDIARIETLLNENK
ncbi:MAG: 50S ribosomal protein L29 [Coxiellaceae bacterium]|nr:50S ribosomal protein L29 [Coxiellaceae bacterium]|tara:strand:- start:5421 stop:5606 length:186 start_codon:yes stop_codon:yes gene_type:complete